LWGSSARTTPYRQERQAKSAAPRAKQPVSCILAELGRDQTLERVQGLGRLIAAGTDDDLAAGAGAEHHETHDRGAGDGLAVLQDGDLRVEFGGALHELGGGARVQA